MRAGAGMSEGLRRTAVAVAAFSALAGASPAWALFGDDEARRQVAELRTHSNERFDIQSKAQLDLSNQIEQLKAEVARLRGQVETLSYELETAKKRQQDFYVDLDNRVRRFETAAEQKAANDAERHEQAQKSDPGEEFRIYEAALNQFKAGKYKESVQAFENFVKQHPNSELAPSAQYWLGNSFYGLRDCRKAVEAQKQLISRWGSHARAADAMLNMSVCQQELGEAKAARQTLEQLVAKYPGTSAAETAAKQLKKK